MTNVSEEKENFLGLFPLSLIFHRFYCLFYPGYVKNHSSESSVLWPLPYTLLESCCLSFSPRYSLVVSVSLVGSPSFLVNSCSPFTFHALIDFCPTSSHTQCGCFGNRVYSFLSLYLAAASLQLCPTLRDPIDSSPPGPSVPGILQARTLEWAAIFFSNAWKWKVKVKSLSRIRLFATSWTAAYQAFPSMGFSRQEYWSGLSLSSLSLYLSIDYFLFLKSLHPGTDFMKIPIVSQHFIGRLNTLSPVHASLWWWLFIIIHTILSSSLLDCKLLEKGIMIICMF